MNYNNFIKSIEPLGSVSYIATTPLGYKIPMVHIGKGKAKTLIVGSIHARENITTLLLNALISDYKLDIPIDYVPMLNIDGVLLATNGLSIIKDENLKRQLIHQNNGSENFSQWKANINGVDLNVNFDADWGEGQQNITYPSSQNYIGIAPHSEVETLAIVELLKNNYSLVLSYHSKGEVIYWGYEYNFQHYTFARKFAQFLNYELTRSEGSCGGLKDYYALNYKGLGLTVEVGENKYPHPYPLEQLDTLIKRHSGSIELLAKTGEDIERIYGESISTSAPCLRP
jgi:g-D-glutamyl-meso-diaminopimelate peptidase